MFVIKLTKNLSKHFNYENYSGKFVFLKTNMRKISNFSETINKKLSLYGFVENYPKISPHMFCC